jgi:hypothetical protein
MDSTGNSNIKLFCTLPDGTVMYYWIRAISDPRYGINGMGLYISRNSVQVAYIMPMAVDFASKTDVTFEAVVPFKNTYGQLICHCYIKDGRNYAGFLIHSLTDPSKILDQAPETAAPIGPTNYLKLTNVVIDRTD